MMGGIAGNGIYSGGSVYGGSRSLPRINSDTDISTGSGHTDVDECEMFVEQLDVEALNDKFEEMLVTRTQFFQKQFFRVFNQRDSSVCVF